MNVATLMTRHADLFAAIAANLNATTAANAANKEANDGRATTTVQLLRDYATVTAGDGVPVEEARKALQTMLTGFDVKAGSVKASGNQFAGFRKLLADGVNIADKSAKDAQDAVASDDTKAMTAVREAFKAHTKGWKLAEWQAFGAREGFFTVPAAVEATEGEVEEGEAAAIVAEAQAA